MERGRDKHRKYNAGRRRPYLTVPFALAAVVMTAFFTPQIIFRIQDSVLYRRTELSQREPMDVEALSSSYETSAYQRMLSFAEGLALGDSFYVTSRNLLANGDKEELDEYLYSGTLYQGILQWMAGMDLIPAEALEYEHNVSQWKQYVVYSDNDTKGVSFLLWYIELSYMNNISVKLLSDAQTGMLYAMSIQGCRWGAPFAYAHIKYEELFGPGSLMELWLLSAAHFEAISSDADLQELIAKSLGMELEETKQENRTDLQNGEMLSEEERIRARLYEGKEDVDIDMEVIRSEINYAAITAYIEDRIESDMEECWARLWLPFGTASLEISLEIGEQTDADGSFYEYPDVIIGARQLYEMIPEFL